ncbi:pilus assembly PilX family protein [Rhodanobacter koreensis]
MGHFSIFNLSTTHRPKLVYIARRYRRFPDRAGQHGVALVTALILLIVVTLVGLAAVRGTIMQQKMTANFYDREIAFQANEAALRQAEVEIQNTTAAAPAGFRDCSPTSGNICLADPLSDASFPASAIKSVPVAKYDAGKLAASQPQYVIEYMGKFEVPVPDVKQLSNCSGYAPCGSTNMADFYRITARSGPADVGNRASVVLQSMYRK